MKLLKIDANGMFIEDVITDTVPTIIVDEVEVNDPAYVQTPCEGGFYHPKWNGEAWVEGRTQLEIDAIVNVPTAPSPEDRLAELENTILFLLMGGM